MFGDNTIELANKNWREHNTIGDRLSITAQDIAPFRLLFAQHSGHVTLREDMTVRVSKRNI